MATPSPSVWASTRRRGFLSLVSPKRRSTGPEHDRKDLQPQHVDEVVLHQRAQQLEAGWHDDPSAGSCFSFETSATGSPLSTVEFFQVGSSRVDDTTYLGRLFNLSANSPLRDGHRATNHS